MIPDDLWRPSRWRTSVATPVGSMGWRFEITVLLAVGAWNVLANQVLPDATHIFANILAGLTLLWYARRNGLTWDLMGLRTDRVRRGLVVGGGALLIIVVVVGVVVAVPETRSYFADDRFVGESAGAMMFEVLVRIPWATAAFEEIIFRGVILGMFLRRMSVLQASLAAALLFGGWHIFATLDGLATNPVGDSVSGLGPTVAVLTVTIGLLGLSGLAFTWLRFRANSLVAPFLAHIGTNAPSYLAGWIIVSRGWG